MAKQAEDREDLLRDATAYERRIEFLPLDQLPIFVGFREGGEPSFYFGQNHVLQYNSQGELRRAFWQDRMLASYKHKLHWLERGAGRVRLTRTPLDEEAYREFAAVSVAALQALLSALLADNLPIKAEVPVAGNLRAEIREWLRTHADEIRLALHPGIRNRR